MARLLAPFAGDASPALARRLIRQFGSLTRALDASPEELAAIAGPQARACELIQAARALMEGAWRSDFEATPVEPDGQNFLRYIRSRFLTAAEERFHVTFCDAGGFYIADEMVASGSSSAMSISARKLFGRALALGADGFVLAHNHPSGACRPSVKDIKATDRVRALGAALGVGLIDHLIVTRSEIYSMRSGGYV